MMSGIYEQWARDNIRDPNLHDELKPRRPCFATIGFTWMDPPPFDDLRRCGAQLSTGWACSSGSPDDRWVSNRQLTRHRSGYSDLSADHGAAKVEQLLGNQSRGNLATQMLPRARDSAPLVRLLAARMGPSRFVWGPERTGPPSS